MHSESLHNTNPSQPFQMLWAVFYGNTRTCYGGNVLWNRIHSWL